MDQGGELRIKFFTRLSKYDDYLPVHARFVFFFFSFFFPLSAVACRPVAHDEEARVASAVILGTACWPPSSNSQFFAHVGSDTCCCVCRSLPLSLSVGMKLQTHQSQLRPTSGVHISAR